jgi:S-adenosylmethionine-dependent methyltransferase
MEKAAEAGVSYLISARQCARSVVPSDETFDAVLLMGPLYHLLTIRERLQAVMEAERVLKPGGLIFAAFITRFALFRDAAAKGYMPGGRQPQAITSSFWRPAFSMKMAAASPMPILLIPKRSIPFMESTGFHTLALVGLEGVVAGHEAHANQLTAMIGTSGWT